MKREVCKAFMAFCIAGALGNVSIAQNMTDGAATAPSTQSADKSVSSETDTFSPMTRSERFKHFLTGTFGRKALARSAVGAEIGELRHAPKEWGTGPSGYGARFGSAFAHHIVRGTLQYGAAAVLHEDDRYLASGKHGFWKRSGYALSSTFIARGDNGHRRFAFARVGSAGGASFISRLWLPHSIATAGAGASSFGVTIAFDAGFNMFREFSPELKRRFRRQ